MLARRAAAVRSGGMMAVLPGAVDNAFTGCLEDDRRKAYAERFSAQDPASYAFALEGILDADISGSLARIQCPTLIIAGGSDVLLPPEHARSIQATLAESELVVIKAGAHFIPYQRPAQFAALVSDFLRRRLAAAQLGTGAEARLSRGNPGMQTLSD